MKLKGSETQITWATSILTDINTVLQDVLAGSQMLHNEKRQAVINKRVAYVKDMLNKIDHAGDVIDKFKKVSYAKNKTTTVLDLIKYYTASDKIVSGVQFGTDIAEYLEAKAINSNLETVEFTKFGKKIKVERTGSELTITIDGIKGKASIATRSQSANAEYNYVITDRHMIDHFSVDADKIVITHDSAKAMFSAIVSN